MTVRRFEPKAKETVEASGLLRQDNLKEKEKEEGGGF